MLQLLEMERKRKKQCAGDVFVLQIMPGIYLYGRIIEAYLKDTVAFAENCHLSVIYKIKSHNEIYSDFNNLENEEWLIPPLILHSTSWNKGFFKTIVNIPLSEKEYSKQYPFVNGNTKKIVDSHNNELNINVEKACILGISSKGLIEKLLNEEFVKNKEWFLS